MGSKAKYGALMGLGEGISGYGKSLAVEESRKESDARAFDRQKSLQEISQQFRTGQVDAANQHEMDKITPGSGIYETYETNRQKIRAEKQEDAESLANIRASSYRGGGRALAALNQSQWTPASFDPYLDEFNALVQAGKPVSEADAIARGNNPLVRSTTAPSTSASDAAANDKAGEDAGAALQKFEFEDDPAGSFAAFLAGLGIATLDELQGLSVFEIAKIYKDRMFEFYQRGGVGLMGAASAPGALPTPGGPPKTVDQSANTDPVQLRK